VVEGKHTFQETTQFKTTGSGVDQIEEHIRKAAWQLTGAGGEMPGNRTRTVIEVIVQDEGIFDKNKNKKLLDFTYEYWKEVIITSALSEGYDKQKPNKTARELYDATNRIVITLPHFRFIFMLFLDEPLFMGGGVPQPAEGLMFQGSKFERHWWWLRDQVEPHQKKPRPDYNYVNIQTHGIGSGYAGVPDKLFSQPRI
jgi:hypothetical protein